jgi:hypothetical protein
VDIAIQNIATRRELECRLVPDRAPETLEEANAALRWFSCPVPREALDDERLSRPERGWVAAK